MESRDFPVPVAPMMTRSLSLRWRLRRRETVAEELLWPAVSMRAHRALGPAVEPVGLVAGINGLKEEK